MSVPAHDERDFEFAQKYGPAGEARDCADGLRRLPADRERRP